MGRWRLQWVLWLGARDMEGRSGWPGRARSGGYGPALVRRVASLGLGLASQMQAVLIITPVCRATLLIPRIPALQA